MAYNHEKPGFWPKKTDARTREGVEKEKIQYPSIFVPFPKQWNGILQPPPPQKWTKSILGLNCSFITINHSFNKSVIAIF